jgi:hypothetical protein
MSVSEVACILRNLKSVPDTAAQVHATAMIALRDAGFAVYPEYPAPYISKRGKFRRGRIDIVVEKDGERTAIEIDARRPKPTSLIKLLSFDGGRIIAVRGRRILPTSGIDYSISINVVEASDEERRDKRTVAKFMRPDT